MNAPFHRGELEAQRLAGVVGNGGGIRAFMPEQHREFFGALPFMLAAHVGADGAVRAQVLHGAPGFVTTPSAVLLEIETPSRFAPGSALGLLGIDLSNRRRNRVNGVVRTSAAGRLAVDVLESFGNCPRHITLRDAVAVAPAPGPVASFAGLSDEARALVARADTFFIASAGGQYGVDISHRGGPRGFVRIDGATLQVPDYAGNRYFNTLGNLVLDPRAALLFIDFASGDVLELQGSVRIDWQRDGEAQERCWHFQCERATLARAALPLRWTER
jgi:predicted pyridoxine 5'-phosphate oxidase superfamily flavin-nucleotide-binding protein